MLGSMLAASHCTRWTSFLFFYAVCFPFGIGINYYVPIVCGWEWFPERKGLVSGLIIGGFGFGAFFFGFITSALANPDDKKPLQSKYFDRDVADRVPHMMRVCVTIWAILSLLAITMVNRKP